MDIIAAHQQGLIEQLEDEVAALAGRGRDHGQRAMVLHHLYDHSRGTHGWALAEARRGLHIVASLAALERRINRLGWAMRNPEVARLALEKLGRALGEAGQNRTAAAYRAYRMSATPALRGQAEQGLPTALLSALDRCHVARRAGDAVASELIDALAEESERLAMASVDPKVLDAAWAAIDATGLKRAARRLLGDKALTRVAARDRRRGWARVERELRNDPALPATFRTNPAQHFYALQHMLRERRRQQWREECDREPDAFELAA